MAAFLRLRFVGRKNGIRAEWAAFFLGLPLPFTVTVPFVFRVTVPEKSRTEMRLRAGFFLPKPLLSDADE